MIWLAAMISSVFDFSLLNATLVPVIGKTANVNEFVHSTGLFATSCDAAAKNKIWRYQIVNFM